MRRVRNYSPSYSREAHHDTLDPPPDSHDARFDPTIDHSSQSRQHHHQQLNGTNDHPEHRMESDPNLSDHQGPQSANPEDLPPTDTAAPPHMMNSTTSNRLNTSLPTSRWQPPSEIQDRKEMRGGGYPGGGPRRPPPPFDRRPVDPADLDLPDTVQSALKVSLQKQMFHLH